MSRISDSKSSAHSRSVREDSEAALTEAAAGYRRIEDFVNKFDDLVVGDWTQGFEDAIAPHLYQDDWVVLPKGALRSLGGGIGPPIIGH